MERRTGFWWSPDSRFVAFTQVDVSDVPLYFIPHTQSPDPAACEEHAYPFAGKANARVQLGVVAVSGDQPVVWCDCDCGGAAGRSEEEYLARVNWGPDNALWVRKHPDITPDTHQPGSLATAATSVSVSQLIPLSVCAPAARS